MAARLRRLAMLALLLPAAVAGAQPVPQPFPRPGAARPADGERQQPRTPPTAPQRPPVERPEAPEPPRPAESEESPPTEEQLGVPVYPNATFLRSYSAGAGQRYYLFGSMAPFADLVGYYRTVLKQRGELVYDAPPVHMFEVGRFDEQTMAFPPGVTIKDYTWGGTGGWLHARLDASPQRYPSIIQVVPVPPSDRRR